MSDSFSDDPCTLFRPSPQRQYSPAVLGHRASFRATIAMRLANVDQQLMFAAQEPVTAPITMEEAVARALKYNLEHRLAMMERAGAEASLMCRA